MRDGASEMVHERWWTRDGVVGGERTGGTESVTSISWKCLECVSSSARGYVRGLQVCGGQLQVSEGMKEGFR